MEPAAADPIVIDSFAAFTLGIIVYFVGARLTKRFSLLSAYSIPEPVSGGLVAAVCALFVVVATGRTIEYDLSVRDFLLVYFFTTVGLNARISDLTRGGPVLAIMLGLTLVFMIVQNGVGALGALLFGLPSQAGVLLGTASLIGGHGTAIAWGPTIASQYGVTGAAELGIAAATVGLILASVLGGPIAKFLITKNSLTATDEGDAVETHEAAATDESRAPINHVEIMRCILWIHVAIVIGYSAHESLLAGWTETAVVRALPDFRHRPVERLADDFQKVEVTRWHPVPGSDQRVQPVRLPVHVADEHGALDPGRERRRPRRDDGAAGCRSDGFHCVRRLSGHGRNYFAAVLSAGFAGFALGATPTAIANMKAVTQRYGPSPLAFIVLPLISAFFVDLANAFIIQWFLSL